MKKFFVLITFISLLMACGSAKDKQEGEGTETKPADDLSSNPDYKKGLALISDSKNLCLTCHKIDEKLTGPAYREVANKYESTEANIKMLAEKVMKGGSGVWGDIAMPPNSSVTEADATAIVKYILLLKK
ncbi:MAG: cytochrome c class I [Bacteroidota bacterium]|nr:cytochrome c class I [Bacteroidota bacterium]